MILRPRAVVLPIVFGVFAGCGAPSSRRATAADHTGGGIRAVPNVSPIRGVDWMNRTYEAGDAQYPVVAGSYEYEIDAETHGSFEVGEPMYGDLDGDGLEEALLVTVETGGGTGRFSNVDVYTMRDGTAALVGTIPGGDRGDGGIHGITLEGRVVLVERYRSQDGDGACCPSQLQHERWSWDGERFVEDEDARTVGDLAVE